MLKVKLLTRTTILFAGEAVSVLLPAKKGEMEILDKHIPIVTVLATGFVRLKLVDNTLDFSISKGIATLVDNELIILSDASENISAIDIDRAQKSKERATERLKTVKSGTYEFRRAAYSLKRAENRIKLFEKAGKS